MKLDATDLRYITPDEFRVLKGIEQGCRSHHVVPSTSIPHLSGLHHSGLNRLLSSLAKRNLIAREQNVKYDGYRLTYGGYDFLAVRAMKEKDHVQAVGHRIGVGKESDIYLVSSPELELENRILKIHRLGRISFRAVKSKRDYTRKEAQRQNFSWMYLSRLAAAKEYQFMQALHEHGFPVPRPIAQSRHTVCMSLIDASPLRQIAQLPKDQIPLLYSALMALIVQLAKAGLIHGDFNEFNLLIRELRTEDEDEDGQYGVAASSAASASRPSAAVATQEEETQSGPSEGERVEQGNGFQRIVATDRKAGQLPLDEAADDDDSESSDEEDGGEGNEASHIHLSDGSTVEPILIDFPQMVSVLHPNAEYFFDRDVACVRRFFRKRFRFVSEEFPSFSEVVPDAKEWEEQRRIRAKLRQAGEESDALKEYMDLDVLTKASGYVKTDKQRGQFEDLDQYLSRMRMGDDEANSSASESEDSEDEDDEEEDGEEQEQDDEEDQDDEADEAVEQSVVQDAQAAAEHEAGVEKAGRSMASRKIKQGEEEDIAAQIQNERRRARRIEAKHHGKKAVAGKVGKNLRNTGGGSKKKSDKVLVRDASVF